jgi:serine/threonine protein kinase
MSLLSPTENVVESRLTRFENDWKNADLESLKSYLTQQPEVDRTLLPELLLTELELSIKAGERFQLESYLQAFPALTSDQTFVNQVVQAEYELRMRLDRNFDAADLRRRFPDVHWMKIESSSHGQERSSTPVKATPRFGPHADDHRFQLKRLHRAGGLGKVWVGLDQQLNREVAIKEIRDDFAQDECSRARFFDEAVITSQLEHPGIVPVYGLGQREDGRPYYAMRLMRGKSLKQAINEYYQSDWKALGPAARAVGLRRLLGHFLDVCNAVHYAHGRGILHRDLKPSNVMLGEYGETVVIDWGLAKHLDTAPEMELHNDQIDLGLGTKTDSGQAREATAAGRVLGSPAYMSPEQAAGNSQELSAATDVYGLGATLYTCLTDKAPFEAETTEDLLAQVRSSQLISPRAVNHEVPAPLAAICMKAMQASPEERYASARELADDVEHYLADEAISAKSDSVVDTWRRFARRNQAIVRAAVVGLISIATIAVIAAFVINTHRQQAESLAKSAVESDLKSQRVLEYLVSAINKPELAVSGNDLTVAMVLEGVASQVELNFPNDPDVRAGLYAALSEAYSNLGIYEQSLEFGKRAESLYASENGPKSREHLLATANVARATRQLGDGKTAVAQLEQVCKQFPLANVTHRSQTTAVHVELVQAYITDGRFDAAVELARRLNDALGPQHEPADEIKVIDALGSALLAQGNFEEALDRHESALLLSYEKLGRTHSTSLRLTDNLANALMSTGKFAEARQLLEPLFADDELMLDRHHPNIISMLRKLAQCRIEGEEAESAIQLIGECHRSLAASLGETHPATIDCLNDLAIANARVGNAEPAVELLELVVELSERQFEANHPAILTHQNNLAHAYAELARIPEAVELMEAVIAGRVESLGAEHLYTLQSINGLALFLRQGGAFAESFELLEQLLPDKRRILGPDHLETILAMHDATMALIRLERFAEAAEIAADYVDVTRRTDFGYLPIALSTLGESLFHLQRFDDAQRALEEACERFGEGPHSFQAFNQILLGRIALAKEDLPQAKALLTQGAKAINLTMKNSPANYRRLFTARSMVALHTAAGNPEKRAAWEAMVKQQAEQIQSMKFERSQ